MLPPWPSALWDMESNKNKSIRFLSSRPFHIFLYVFLSPLLGVEHRLSFRRNSRISFSHAQCNLRQDNNFSGNFHWYLVMWKVKTSL